MTPEEAVGTVIIVFIILLIFSIPMGCVGYYYGDDIKDRVNVIYVKMLPEYQKFTNVVGVKELSAVEKVAEITEPKYIVAVLADWCGHCRSLKASGELDSLAEDVKVFMMTDKHPEAKVLMESTGSRGFPTIVLVNNGKKSLYQGERTAQAILKALG